MQVRFRGSFGSGRESLLPNSRLGRRAGNVSITMTPAESKGTATKHQHRAAASNPRRTSVKSLAYWARPVLGIEASRNSAAEAPPVVNARRRRRSRHNFEAFSTTNLDDALLGLGWTASNIASRRTLVRGPSMGRRKTGRKHAHSYLHAAAAASKCSPNALAAPFSPGTKDCLEGIRTCQGLLQPWSSRNSS